MRYIQRFLFILFLCVQTTAHAETHIVRLIDFAYVPRDITIQEGDRIRWIWDTDNHNVVSGEPFGTDGAFETTVENTGFEAEVTFDRTYLNSNRVANFKYDYYCLPHIADDMFGSVTVVRPDKDFVAAPRGWQMVPENTSEATAECNVTLLGDETQFSISCTHTLGNFSRISLYAGILGETGESICTLDEGETSGTCTITNEIANRMFSGEVYVQLSSTDFPSGELRGQITRAGGEQSISGTVMHPDGSMIDGATISNGTISTTSASDGTYTLNNLINGVYRLTATKEGYNLIPRPETSPVVVNSRDLNQRPFEVAPSNTCGVDTDRDGVCDKDELAQGSSKSDAGSYRDILENPTYILWNGFIDIINILELLNTSDSALQVTVTLYNISGGVAGQLELTLNPFEQRDLIINDFEGFSKDSYGIIGINYPSERKDDFDGRMFFYRPGSGTDYQFAFGTSFSRPLYGTSAVAFNTFQPSLATADAGKEVAQWLSIANLDQNQAKSFTVKRYDQGGTLLSTTDVAVPAFGRADIEAGHITPGANQVGQHIIEPQDPISPYLAQLSRYGGNNQPGSNPTDYEFAFNLVAKVGNGQRQLSPISTGAGAENWLELVNTTDGEIEVAIEIYNNNGEVLSNQSVTISAFAQQHLNVGTLLAAGDSGTVSVTSNTANSVIGTSMFYFRNSDGSIAAMYGSQLTEPFGNSLSSSYNLFLGMDNWLRVSNITDQAIELTLSVYASGGGSVNTSTVNLEPRAGVDFGIHNAGQFDTVADSIGIITIETDSSAGIFSELLRMRIVNGSIDFAAPVSVR